MSQFTSFAKHQTSYILFGGCHSAADGVKKRGNII